MTTPGAWSTVQFEDERIRVTRWDVPPGQAIGLHTHEHDYVVVPVVDGRVGIEPAVGERSVSEMVAGRSYHREAGAVHVLVNDGGQHLAFVELELLDTRILPSSRLEHHGVVLPPPPAPVGSYVAAVRHGDTITTTGQLPFVEGALVAEGVVGEDVDVDTATQAARVAALNAIAAAAESAGGVDRIDRVLQVTGHIACAPGFAGHSAVMDGASDLIVQVFGDAGLHVRTNIGSPALPLRSPVEIELVVALSDGQRRS
jgi:enamine deaminase RidA (YjgF/YER057c/UK114 family)/quercetin dioxygenase-like cupin family protein